MSWKHLTLICQIGAGLFFIVAVVSLVMRNFVFSGLLLTDVLLMIAFAFSSWQAEELESLKQEVKELKAPPPESPEITWDNPSSLE